MKDNTFISASLITAVMLFAGPVVAQEKHSDPGILGEIVSLLGSINSKLDGLKPLPPSTTISPRAAVFVTFQAKQCSSGSCNTDAANMCKRWSYPKGEPVMVHPGNPFAGMSSVICFD